MLIYHKMCTAGGDMSDAVDVVDANRTAVLCVFEGEYPRGGRIVFVFDDDPEDVSILNYLEEVAAFSVYVLLEKLTSLRLVRPEEVLTVDDLVDYRTRCLPALKEVM